MGIILVYDITNARSFDNIAKWLRNIDEVYFFSLNLAGEEDGKTASPIN